MTEALERGSGIQDFQAGPEAKLDGAPRGAQVSPAEKPPVR